MHNQNVEKVMMVFLRDSKPSRLYWSWKKLAIKSTMFMNNEKKLQLSRIVKKKTQRFWDHAFTRHPKCLRVNTVYHVPIPPRSSSALGSYIVVDMICYTGEKPNEIE